MINVLVSLLYVLSVKSEGSHYWKQQPVKCISLQRNGGSWSLCFYFDIT